MDFTVLIRSPITGKKGGGYDIVDLIACALLSTGGGAPLSAQLTLTRVKFWIESHLTEKLCGEEIARHCNLSLRHLNRLFESEDTSLMQYVWKRRLARSWRDLCDPAQRHRSIGEIALANGFNNLSHFSREGFCPGILHTLADTDLTASCPAFGYPENYSLPIIDAGSL
jgi:AraC-like DNA-binding protein